MNTLGRSALLCSEVHTLGVMGGLHAARGLAKAVREVDVPFSHDGLMQSRKLSDHLRHGLLQQVLLLALLHVFFAERDQMKAFPSRVRQRTKPPPLVCGCGGV